MRILRFASLFVIAISAMVLAQSNPVPPVSRAVKAASLGVASGTGPKTQAKILDSYGKLPLSFEANHGQTDSQVKFLSRGSRYTLFLTGDEAVFSFRGGEAKGNNASAGDRLPSKAVAPTGVAVLRMKLVSADHAAAVTGLDELPGKSNYFIGNDPEKWSRNIPTFAKVKYEGIYKGIDLIYYGNQRQLEYDFVVSPGADPDRIRFDVRGTSRIRLDEDGDLMFKMGEGEIRWQRPVVYQERNGAKQQIAARYVIKDTNHVGFELARYDTSRPLYIDPLIYSTYLGGSADDFGSAIAVDSSGNAYVTGYASSIDFPTMDPLQSAYGGGGDAFVTEINSGGSALVYSTYLGGSGEDQGCGIAVDNSGDVYVTGFTSSTNFPTMNPLQSANGGDYDAFVTEINAGGAALVYSTYLGGSSYDFGSAIAVDGSGDAYVTGYTYSTNFPTMNPLQPQNGGGTVDAFVTKINAGGSALVYSTYLGGSAEDQGSGIAVDSSGSAYVTGNTDSTNFPTMNPFQKANGGDTDAFVAKLQPSGSALIYSTYLGGKGVDQGFGIAVDGSGNAYVTGSTASTDFPTMNPLQPQNANNVDAFVTEINAAGSALIYSTYLGGKRADFGYAIAVDSSGDAYVTGLTSSVTFPTMNPLQPAYGGGSEDAFATEISAGGSAFIYSTYLGGSGDDVGYGIALGPSGATYVTGFTSSADFPTMNPLQAANGGGSNAFVAKIGTLNLQLTPKSVKFGTHPVKTKSGATTITLTNKSRVAISISGISITGTDPGDFGQTNTCGKSLAAGASCVIKVTFNPQAKGVRTAEVSITDNAAGSPQKVSLRGTGT
jgi:Beta-propeller repeat